MKVSIGVLVAIAGLMLSRPARAVERGEGESRLLDSRLGEAETFGRYVDHSKRRLDAVSSPQWRLELARPVRRESAALARPGLIPPSIPGPEPASPVLTSEPGPASPRPGIPPAGWAILGAGAVGLGVLLAFAATAERPRKKRIRGIPAPATTSPIIEEPLSPILPWSPANEPAAPQTRRWEAPPEPATLDNTPHWVASWKAVSAQEQRAIDAWDRSVEKKLGLASLEQWLDLHAESLGTLDIPHLKAKLRRDA